MKTPSYRINRERHEVYVGKSEVVLAPKERDILITLADSGKTMSREELTAVVWGEKVPSDPRLIDAHIARLRRKMKPATAILTVFGKGYKIAL